MALPDPNVLARQLEGELSDFLEGYAQAHEFTFGLRGRQADPHERKPTSGKSDPTGSAPALSRALRSQLGRSYNHALRGLRALSKANAALEDLADMIEPDPPLEVGGVVDVKPSELKRQERLKAERRAGDKSAWKGPGNRHEIS